MRVRESELSALGHSCESKVKIHLSRPLAYDFNADFSISLALVWCR